MTLCGVKQVNGIYLVYHLAQQHPILHILVHLLEHVVNHGLMASCVARHLYALDAAVHGVFAFQHTEQFLVDEVQQGLTCQEIAFQFSFLVF